jgi:ElaB/YqjD/DUF883 family membrane-anchored ribosome-binding protein
MSTVRDQIKEKSAEAIQGVEGLRAAAEDAAAESLDSSCDTVSQCCGQARDKVLHAKRTVQQLIVDLPIKSVLIALGAGVLLGTFWTIRRR